MLRSLRFAAVLAIGTANVGASCAKMPDIRPRSAVVARVCATHLVFRLEVDVYNDNPAGAMVDTVNVDLTIGTQRLPPIVQTINQAIPKKKWTTVAVFANVPSSAVPNLLLTPLLFKDLPYAADGVVRGSAMGDSFTKKFHLTGALSRAELIVMAKQSADAQVKAPVGMCAY